MSLYPVTQTNAGEYKHCGQIRHASFCFFYCFFNLCKYSCGNISIFFISAFFANHGRVLSLYLTYNRHFLFGLYCCHFIFNTSFMENYTFFQWLLVHLVSCLQTSLNPVTKKYKQGIFIKHRCSFWAVCCVDSRLKGEEKWSVHVGGGLLLKKILLLISVALCLSLLSLQEEVRLNEWWWLKRLCVFRDQQLCNRMGKVHPSLDDPAEEKEGKILRLKEQE